MAMSAQVKICSPSPAMLTSTYEWKILEWDEKPQTNKPQIFMHLTTWVKNDKVGRTLTSHAKGCSESTAFGDFRYSSLFFLIFLNE